jgi:hypothetical protein
MDKTCDYIISFSLKAYLFNKHMFTEETEL